MTEKHQMGRTKGSKNHTETHGERSISFFITINTPSEQEKRIKETIESSSIFPNIRYAKFCIEEGEQNQREHIHIYLHFKRSERFSAVKKLFPRADIEEPIGTPQQQIEYIGNPNYKYSDKHSNKEKAGKIKGGTCSYCESIGSTEGIRLDKKALNSTDERLIELKNLLDEGFDLYDLYEHDFPMMIKYMKGISEYAGLQQIRRENKGREHAKLAEEAIRKEGELKTFYER